MGCVGGWTTQKRRSSSSVIYTFDLPAASRSPASADTDKLEVHAVWVLPGHERGSLVLTAHSDDTVVCPTDPEATELARVQDSRGIDLDHIGLCAVLPDHRLGVLPATEEDLEHGVGFGRARGQRHMGIVLSAHLEADDSSGRWVELVLQLVFGAELWT